MILLVASLTVLASVLGAAGITQLRRRKAILGPAPAATSAGSVLPSGALTDRARFGAILGDVFLRTSGDTALCESALVFSEGEHAVAVLFGGPDRGGETSVYVLPPPASSVFWLTEMGDVDRGALAVDPSRSNQEPPTVVEVRGTTFERTRRLPVTAIGFGPSASVVASGGTLAEYPAGNGERMVAYFSSAHGPRAYRGVELLAGTFEVLPGGEAPLPAVKPRASE